jgi:hypothetical protein
MSNIFKGIQLIEQQLDELSPETLSSYKKKAGAEASALDKAAWGGAPDAQDKINKANKRFSGIVRATKKELDNDVKNIKENAEELNIGDPVIISGDVQFNDATGDIIGFSNDKHYVIVDLYNHGKRSFHSSDVSFNDHADSDDEEARMYDAGELRDVDEGKMKSIDVDRQDHDEMSPQQFYGQHGRTKTDWEGQFSSLMNPKKQKKKASATKSSRELDYCPTCQRGDNRCVCEGVAEGSYDSEDDFEQWHAEDPKDEMYGVGDTYKLGVLDYKKFKQTKVKPSNPYSYTKQARQADSWDHGFEDGQYKQGMAEETNNKLQPGSTVTVVTAKGREYTGTLSRETPDVVVLKVQGTTGDAHGLGNQPASNVVAIKRKFIKSITPALSEDLPPPENARKTQIAGTLPTYKKAADILNKTGVQGKALDFGAGLGMGTGELGPDADSYEPFPGDKFKPHFVDVTKIPDNSYHKIVNLNVLNVVPNTGEHKIRDSIVKNIGRVLAPGGVAIITTRGKDVLTIKGTPGEEPTSMISKIGTYQKGFTQKELLQYIQQTLGQGFEVSSIKLGPAGVMIKKLDQQTVSEGYDEEELANEVYSEFERIYPNLARKANERTVHSAIMDVLNYGGDSNPSALAQDVARAVKRDIEQGLVEAGYGSNRGYTHGFASPTAPKLGNTGRRDDERNSEFDDKMRAITGMIFYNNVDDPEEAMAIGLKQTSKGKWYLRTGNRLAQKVADNRFGPGKVWYPTNEDAPAEVDEGVLGFIARPTKKAAPTRKSTSLADMRKEFEKDKLSKTPDGTRSKSPVDGQQFTRQVTYEQDVTPSESKPVNMKRWLRDFERREDNNFHTENVLAMAQLVGTPEDVATMKQLVKQHRGFGLSEKQFEIRQEISNRLRPLVKQKIADSQTQGVAEAVWDRHSQSHIPRDGRTFGQNNHPREEHCDSCGAPTGHAGPGEDSNVDDNGNVYCDDCYADEQGVAEAELDEECWKGYTQYGMKDKNGKKVPNCVPVDEALEETYNGDDEFYEAYGDLWYDEDMLNEAKYQGHTVQLGKPMQGDVKKFKVYVKDPSTGNIKKVNFGDPNSRIKKSNPARRKSFRARHNCENPGPRTKARYWSCRKW